MFKIAIQPLFHAFLTSVYETVHGGYLGTFFTAVRQKVEVECVVCQPGRRGGQPVTQSSESHVQYALEYCKVAGYSTVVCDASQNHFATFCPSHSYLHLVSYSSLFLG